MSFSKYGRAVAVFIPLIAIFGAIWSLFGLQWSILVTGCLAWIDIQSANWSN